MKNLQEAPAEARADEWWAFMEPVFHLDQQELAVVRIAESTRAS